MMLSRAILRRRSRAWRIGLDGNPAGTFTRDEEQNGCRVAVLRALRARRLHRNSNGAISVTLARPVERSIKYP